MLIISLILALLGIAGCMAPVLPGPPLNYAAVALLYFFSDKYGLRISDSYMIIWFAVTVLVTVLDYVVPSFLTRLTGGSSAGGKGALAGMFVGIFLLPPLGMIMGAFLGAMLAELLISGRSLQDSLFAAFGSFLGFILGTGMKLIVSVMLTIKLIMVVI